MCNRLPLGCAPRRGMLAGVRFLVAAALVVSACGQTVLGDRTGARDDGGGAGPSAGGQPQAGGSPSGSGTGGTKVVRDASATRDGTAIPDCYKDAGIDAAPSDAASRPAIVSGPEATAPPPHCFAPCVWDLMKRCQMQAPCTTEEYPGGMFGPNYVSCTSDASRWKITTVAHISHSDEYYLGSCACYSYSTSLMGTTGGAWAESVASWFDEAGHYVATGILATSTMAGTVCCSSTFPPTTGDCYDVDPSQPDCAPWMDPKCASGTCPPPPKVPVSPY